MPRNKKAQIFTWDIILATVIFLIVLASILFLWTETTEDIDSADTEYEIGWLATAVAEQLARTPGSPTNWTKAPNVNNITVIGLADTFRIGNETRVRDRVLDPDKVIEFINLTQRANGYSPLRNRLFGTGKYDFYVELSCMDSSVLDCFEGLRMEGIRNYNITCNASNLTFYISNYTLKSDPALVAVWRLDEGSGSVSSDSSGGGSDLSVYGASWTSGKYGTALSFDGTNDYASASPAQNVSAAYTVALWAKVADTGTRTMLSTRGPSDYSFDMKFRNGNEVNANIGTGTAWMTNNANALLSYQLNQWYHIIYAVNQTRYRIFINGTLAAEGGYSTAGTPLLLDVNHTINLGRRQDGTEYYTGTIDDVKIWRRALSNEEALAEYVRSEKYCRFGRNVSFSNVSYQMFDTKTVTFRKARNASLFDDDTTLLEPTANLKVVVYRLSH